jgi:hypothetical protein
VRDEIRQKVAEFASHKIPALVARGAAAGMKS